MGKVISLIKKLREMSNHQLVTRFKHINRAQAIREYLAAKEDPLLSTEVNLAEEEIIGRMAGGNKIPIIPETTDEENEASETIDDQEG